MKLRLPAVFNKFLQPISVSAEEFFPQWRSLSGPPLKLQEVVWLLCFISRYERKKKKKKKNLKVKDELDDSIDQLTGFSFFFLALTKISLKNTGYLASQKIYSISTQLSTFSNLN